MFVDFQWREYNGSVNGVPGNGTYEPLPEITVCALDTVLVWVPCGFLLLISPLYLYHLFGLKTRGTATWLNISKTVSPCFLELYGIPRFHCCI